MQRRRIHDLLASRATPLFLNLGSGPRGIDDAHWVNVDGFRDQNVHYLVDFGRPLPSRSESFDGVFCEHVIEHFSLGDGERLAREVHRILRPGGCFRVIVPDAELLLRRYFDAPNEMVSRRGTDGETPMEVVNLYFRQRYEHQFFTIGRQWRRCCWVPDLQWSLGRRLVRVAIVHWSFWTTKSMSGRVFMLKRSNLERIGG